MNKLIKHGMFGTRPYGIWKNMKSRCNRTVDKDYPKYGGRGISYDKKWETFIGFWSDMSKGYNDDLTIDRIDNNGDYCKSNCRWANLFTQNRNRRNTVMLTHNGVTLPLVRWSETINISATAMYQRKYKGWSDEKIIETRYQYKDISDRSRDSKGRLI